MKIYQINVVYGYGSTGRIVSDLSNVIEQKGWECRVAFGRKKNTLSNINCVKIGNDLEVLTHVVLSRFTGRHGLFSKNATQRLIKDIECFNPDIIHLHNIHGYYLNFKILFDFLKSYDRPVVWTMHDCWAFTGHCAYYEGVCCDEWQRGCYKCKAPQTYPKAYTHYNTRLNYNRKKKAFLIPQVTIVTPSNWLKNQLRQSFLGRVPCTVINNGIDLGTFMPVSGNKKQKMGIEDKKMILGVASVWTHNKGLDDMLRLAERISEKYVVCLVGLTKKQICSLPSGVLGIKRTDSLEELAEYYSTADVFLNLTYEDNFPTTNIEALACGTPVITYCTGGSVESISEECGAVVRKGDIDAVIEQVEIWANRACEEECRNRAMFFEKNKCYEKYIDYYDRVCKKNGKIEI